MGSLLTKNGCFLYFCHCDFIYILFRSNVPSEYRSVPISSRGYELQRSGVSSRDQCHPRDQLVFLKTHKTGSTTLQLILQIYGYFRNSSFLFNAKDKIHGHIRFMNVSVKGVLPPISVPAKDYKRYYNQFDMSTIHIRYNRSYLNSMMKSGAKYISILRDPVSQFESAFVFFGHYRNARQSVDLQIEKFLRNPKNQGGLIDNSQIVDLGMDTKNTRNKLEVKSYIQKLSQDFDLMLITEHFDESLLLLRKLMCWNFSNIKYIKQNARSKECSQLSEPIKEKIRKWNAADLKLYQHFNKTLWKKIWQYGPNFQSDLQYFKLRQSRVYNSCVADTVFQNIPNVNHRIAQRKEYKVKQKTTEHCKLLTDYTVVFQKLWERQRSLNDTKGLRGYCTPGPYF